METILLGDFSVYLLYDRSINLSPSKLEFSLIMYFILYVCPLMVNKNNSYCFKWSSIQLLLDSKFYHFFTLFFSRLSYNVIEDFWETYCNLWGFATNASPAVEKGLRRIKAVLYCSIEQAVTWGTLIKGILLVILSVTLHWE